MRRAVACLTFCLLLPALAPAASILQVKGKKAMIDVEGLDLVEPGTELVALDGSGKRRALLRVVQVKGRRAVAEIAKGRAEAGFELESRAGTSGASSAGPMSRDEGDARFEAPTASGKSAGLLLGLVQTSMTASFKAGTGTLTREITATMGGSSFGLTGFYDYPITPRLQIRGMAGYEQLNASGSIDTADCTGTTTCDFKVSYLSLYGLGKFNFSTSPSRLWLTGGAGFLIAMSKASSVLNTSQISTNQIFSVGLGYDVSLGRRKVMPISFEYGLFPPSDTVKATVITVRAGYAWGL